MARDSVLTQDRLRQLLSYDPATGLFTFTVTRGGIVAGSVAGSPDKGGYIRILIDGKLYAAHRLAFLWMTGSFPKHDADHRNGIRSDNRWSNLRPATRAENMQNYPTPVNSTTQLLGVSWHKQKGRWRAQIKKSGRKLHLGYFDTAEDAHVAYLAAKARLHEFQPSPRG